MNNTLNKVVYVQNLSIFSWLLHTTRLIFINFASNFVSIQIQSERCFAKPADILCRYLLIRMNVLARFPLLNIYRDLSEFLKKITWPFEVMEICAFSTHSPGTSTYPLCSRSTLFDQKKKHTKAELFKINFVVSLCLLLVSLRKCTNRKVRLNLVFKRTNHLHGVIIATHHIANGFC